MSFPPLSSHLESGWLPTWKIGPVQQCNKFWMGRSLCRAELFWSCPGGVRSSPELWNDLRQLHSSLASLPAELGAPSCVCVPAVSCHLSLLCHYFRLVADRKVGQLCPGLCRP